MIFRRGFEVKNKIESMNIDDERILEFLGIKSEGLNVKGKNALREATVFACIKILSESVAKLPIKIYRGVDGISKATDHYLYNILKIRPNPYMSSADFFRSIETQRNLYGNAYANIEYDNRGKIKALWPIDSTKVEVFMDHEGVLDSKNKLWYVVTTNDNKKVKLKPSEILHFKGFTVDGLTGITPLAYLRTLIENGKSAEDYINKFYKNGMQTKGIIQYIGDLDSKAEEVFRTKFEQMSSGLKNAHRVSMLPLGYQFQPMSLTMADAQFLENTELTIRQIASVFGIKMHQLNELSRSTHTNISEQQRQFYIDTLMSILTMYEQEMTYKTLLNSELDSGFYCRFNVDAILRADPKTRYEGYRVAIQSGFMTPNEVRSREELEAKEGADDLIINGNMMKVTQAGSQYMKGGEGNT